MKSARSWRAVLVAGSAALVAGGCTVFGPAGAPPASTFALTSFTLAPSPLATDAEGGPRAGEAASGSRIEIEVAAPNARAGFDGPRMAYVKRAYEIQYFARHQWVEAPARMLGPLVGEALEHGGRFRAMASGQGAPAAMRLETEIVALQQEFTTQSSQVRFALRARLFGGAERRLLAAAAFEAIEPSPSEDPYGGVIAANRAVARVLDELVAWCSRAGSTGGAGGGASLSPGP
jgi:cholesterol transport system auxiliary component